MTQASKNHPPNFIVIGPGKSGTSWLYHVLQHHPQVCMSSAKETLYFEDYYTKGPRWYARFFRKCHHNAGNHDGPIAVGEISNTYIFSPVAAQRIASDFPSIKIIATLRDPTERAFSHYLFLRRNAELNCSFEEALERRPDIKTRGKYFEHLQPYRELFPENQLAIFFFDDLKKDVVCYSSRLFDFLEIGDIPDASILHERILEASEPRSKLLARLTVGAAHAVRRLGFPDIVTKVKQGLLPKLVFRPMKQGKKPRISPATELDLREYYQDDLAKLEEWLGGDVIHTWKPRTESLEIEHPKCQ